MQLETHGALYLTLGGKLKLVVSWYFRIFFLFAIGAMPSLPNCNCTIIVVHGYQKLHRTSISLCIFQKSFIMTSPLEYINNCICGCLLDYSTTRCLATEAWFCYFPFLWCSGFYAIKHLIPFSFNIFPWSMPPHPSSIFFCFNCSLSLLMRRVLRLKESAVGICV